MTEIECVLVGTEYLSIIQVSPGLPLNVSLIKIILFVSDVGALDLTPPTFLILSAIILSLNVHLYG
jgi:hypothetical protein